MKQIVKYAMAVAVTFLVTGCIPQPKPNIPTTPQIGDPIHNADYGYPPSNYQQSIRSYFSNRINRSELANYQFSKPQRAYKRNGLAYGGDVTWKGWLVDVSIAVPNKTGRMMSAKPYMVLFTQSVIVEDILGSDHQLVTRVGQ